VEIAVHMKLAAKEGHGSIHTTTIVGVIMLLISLIFVWRSFYAMRIPEKNSAGH